MTSKDKDLSSFKLSEDDRDKKSNGSKGTKKGSTGSKKSSAKSKLTNQVESDEISMSQLDLLANKKKLAKKGEISVSQLLSHSKKDEASASNSPKESKKQQRVSLSNASISSISDTRSEEREKRKAKTIFKENKNENVRKEKSELLYKFSKMNVKGKWSSLNLDMNCSLDEIKNEYTRVKNEIQSERSVSFLKRMLLLGVQGIEMVNNKFDPLGVDLDGWSEAMGYSLENQDYDEVMAELYEKYKGAGQMSPEMRLIFMIISSATMFTITKKISKLDSSNTFTNIISSFMGQQQPPMQQQMYQQQQNYQQQAMQQNYGQEYEFSIPNPNDLRNAHATRPQHYGNIELTETTEDPTPSKMQGPNTNLNLGNDNVDINNILKQMNARKLEKEKKEERSVVESSEDVFKSIPLNTGKRGRGRPRKQAVGKTP